MPETSLYWIDDSAQDMYLIMEHVFPAAWDKGCVCKTVLFGNDYCSKETENGPSEENREAFEADLDGFFIIYCQEIDAREWCKPGTTYGNKQRLLPSPSVALIPIENDESDPMRKLANHWMDRARLERFSDVRKRLIKREKNAAEASGGGGVPEAAPAAELEPDAIPEPDAGPVPIPGADTAPEVESGAGSNPAGESGPVLDPEPGSGSAEETEMSVDGLIAKMEIPDHAVVALDICLLYKDIDRIGAGLPSISMALYAALSKKHHCYLYSNRSIARTVMDNWINTYKELFGDSDKLTIHPKNGLTAKQADTDAKQDLLALLDGKE